MAGDGAAADAAALEAAGTTASEPELAVLLSLDAAASPLAPPIAARRSRLLAKRCSGTSVNPASAALGC
jgi:hypothetical protein